MSRRTERVGEQIRAELARLLLAGVTDPRVQLVTLTRVDLAPDFRNARIYWSRFTPGEEMLDDELRASTQAGLESAAGFLRSGLARALPMKRVPELRFEHDASLALGARTLALIAELEHGPE